MRRLTFGIATIFVAAFGLIGCTAKGGPLADFDAPDQLTLYSIDGRDEHRLEGVKSTPTETFLGYPVLGKVEISDAAERRRLISAIKDAYSRRPEMGAKCFWPRHGVRAIERGRTVEVVICFQCSRFEEFVGDDKLGHHLLNSDVQPTFDKPLTGAGIEIAPK